MMLAEQVVLSDEVQTWATIWFWLLIVGGAIFLGILAYSVVAGAMDIKELFVALQAAEDEAQGKAASQDPGADAERHST